MADMMEADREFHDANTKQLMDLAEAKGFLVAACDMALGYLRTGRKDLIADAINVLEIAAEKYPPLRYRGNKDITDDEGATDD